jgi:carboxyl-terminal processing protease
MRRLPKIAPLLVLGLFLSVTAGARPADSPQTEANIARLTVRLLESSQFAHHRLDAELAGRFLDRYLDALDGSRSIFFQSDLDEFARFRENLAQATRERGSTAPAHEIFARALQRLGERLDYVNKQLRTTKFTFTGNEVYSFDRDKAPRPRDLAAAQALWRDQLRADYLQEKLAGKKPEQIATALGKRYAQQLRTLKQLSRDEVLEIYLNALAHVYDPHSDYMGHQQLETFSMSMSLKLFGIGAQLENEDGYCKIRELVPGGPAARSGLLRPGDRIIAVAQGNEEAKDIVNIPLQHAVEMIRGPKGTRVTLTILPAGSAEGAAPKKVLLVRDEIKLEEQQAKAQIVEWPTGAGASRRLGVIDLPSFYAELGGPQTRASGGGGQRSATADVQLLLNKLKAEKVDGIVLDLRRNGGGSLEEAIKLTGLFIRSGPVVQTRGPDGDVDIGADTDPSILYDGPLVVLISRFSASASEILAGAVQDYGRGVVIGDSATFGKGTVQNLLPLQPLMERQGLSFTYNPGALKVTIRKFYRPGGSSTQLRGVASDIVLPSPTDIEKFSEASLTDPLPWDSLPAARFQPVNRVKAHLPRLREGSAQRVAGSKPFAFLKEEIALIKKDVGDKSISLNEAERKKELAEAKERRKRREQEERALQASRPRTYEITLKNAGMPGLPAPMKETAAKKPDPAAAKGKANEGEDEDGPAGSSPVDDIILNESLQVLSEYANLLAGKPPVRIDTVTQ